MQVSYRNGMILVFSAAVLWSLMGLVLRWIGDVGTWQVLFYRSAGMVPVLLVLMHLRTRGHPFRSLLSVGWPGLIGGTGLVFAFAGAIFAIQTTSVANAVFLFASAPLMTAFLAWAVLREPTRARTWISIALAAFGVFVMVREGLAMGARDGNLAALMSSAGFAVFTITLRWGKLSDMLPAVIVGGILSFLTAAAIIWLRDESLIIPLRSAVLSATMGAGILGLGMTLYTIGSRVVPAAEIGILSLAEVMLGPVWVWLVLGETTTRGTLVGAAILLAAIAFNALTGARQATPAPG